MTNSKNLFWLINIIAIVLCNGCSILEDPEEQTLISIDSVYSLSMNQELVEGPNPLKLIVTTNAPPQCDAAHIEIENKIDGDKLVLMVGNIMLPEDCKPTQNLLSGTADYDITAGNYQFDINFLHTINNSGKLEASEYEYILNMESHNGIDIIQNQILQIPDGLFWGEMIINDVSQVSIFNNFDQELNFRKPKLDSGYYGHFEIENLKLKLFHNNVDDDIVGSTSLQFIYQNDNIEFLKDVLERYRTNYPNLQIKVITSEGLNI